MGSVLFEQNKRKMRYFLIRIVVNDKHEGSKTYKLAKFFREPIFLHSDGPEMDLTAPQEQLRRGIERQARRTTSSP